MTTTTAIPSNRSEVDTAAFRDGTLSWDEFRIAARAFEEQWNKFNTELPQFSWVSRPKPRWLPPTSQSEGYLSVENVIIARNVVEGCCKEGDEEAGKEEELSCSEENDDGFMDPASFVGIQAQNDELSYHYYEFHVVYNVSYRVPVLYFRAYCSDGQALGLDDIVKSFPSDARKLLTESKWTFITQEDHPFLNLPWNTLHPCGTSEWMKMLLNSDPAVAQGGARVAKYLVSWFSVVGQVFGLKIPNEMLG